MKDFFASIYELFINLYGNELADHLFGSTCDSGESYGGQYGGLGLLLFVSTFILVAIYYYVYVTASRNRWYHWLYWLIGGFIFQFLVGFYLPYRDLSAELVCDNGAFMTEDAVFFGLINGLLSAILFVIFSFLIRWWSVDGKRTPYPL